MAQRIPFRKRGEQVSRVDGFSDVVFGFALTLLVVSLEVPHGYADLVASLRGFIPFAICFAILIQIWYTHYVFFRRYGLEDLRIIVLNSLLLFVVLLYVYPLKFLWRLIIEGANEALTPHQGRVLLSFYGGGFVAIWMLFYFMFREALRRGQDLELNAVEVVDTRESMAMCISQAAVGALAILLALVLPDRIVGLSGIVYTSLALTNSVIGSRYGKMRREVEEQLLAQGSGAAAM